MKSNFILYVKDQSKSTSFYQSLLNMEPTLNVPGMTEFNLGIDSILGLMPNKGIKKLLGTTIQDPEETSGVSRCELYLIVENPSLYMDRAKHLKASVLSPLSERNWGDKAGYIMDFDGHVIAFAKKL